MLLCVNFFETKEAPFRAFLSALAIAVVSAVTFVILCSLFPSAAFALTVDEARAKLDATEASMQQAIRDYDAAMASYQEIQTQIEKTTADLLEAQTRVIEGRENLGDVANTWYRSGQSSLLLSMFLKSDSVNNLLHALDDYQEIMDHYSQQILEQKKATEEFNALLSELDEQRDRQEKMLNDSEAAKAEAQRIVDEVSAELTNAQNAEAGRLEALRAENTRLNGSDGYHGSSTSSGSYSTNNGWYSGVASAYGGRTDEYTSNPSYTATGAICTEGSMGVAIPMSMPNYRSYFGRSIEIRYGDQTVVAVVNDCGGLGGSSRALDLQPGVFGAFGFSSCNSWGVRTVSYRFL